MLQALETQTFPLSLAQIDLILHANKQTTNKHTYSIANPQEALPESMSAALDLHDRALRKLISRFFGFEIATEGDSFLVAFHEASDALGWCLASQLILLAMPWPRGLLLHPKGAVVTERALYASDGLGLSSDASASPSGKGGSFSGEQGAYATPTTTNSGSSPSTDAAQRPAPLRTFSKWRALSISALLGSFGVSGRAPPSPLRDGSPSVDTVDAGADVVIDGGHGPASPPPSPPQSPGPPASPATLSSSIGTKSLLSLLRPIEEDPSAEREGSDPDAMMTGDKAAMRAGRGGGCGGGCPEGEEPVLFRGLRVRMGVATGIPDHVERHPVTQRREYHGAVVSRVQNVSDLSHGASG